MLRQTVERYLEIRRTAGFELKVDAGLLRSFARISMDRSETCVRRQTAIDWAAKAPTPSQQERRLGMVRRFSEHARAEDPRHEIVPRNVFANSKRRRPFPYIFSSQELLELLDATDYLRPRGSLRPRTYYTLFGLVATVGLRISEAMHLVLDDVTADGLVVRKSKFRKSRLLPLHETTQAALDRYLEQRQAIGGGDNHVFISTQGHALTYAMINGTFHYLVKHIHLRLRSDQRPRIHDLRHYYAVRVLEGCPTGCDGVTHHILALSTYLGHAHVTDTYWYLQATPYLMTGIADACEAFFQGGKP